MEHISDILAKSKRLPNSKLPKSILEEPEPIRNKYPRVSEESHTFETFKAMPGTATAFKLAKEISDGKGDIKMLLMYGGVGCGKTHLLDAITMRLNDRGIYTVYNVWSDVIGKLREHLFDNSEPPFEVLLRRICFSPTLILDDFGMGSNPNKMDWEFAQLEKIIKYRYRDELLTVLATNRDLDQLPERVVSCFADSDIAAIVLNSGEDYRILKEGKGNA